MYLVPVIPIQLLATLKHNLFLSNSIAFDYSEVL